MGIRPAGIFSTIPQTFFSPLASPNRAHYAALLVLYYRLFQESPHGIERKTLIGRFAEYFDAHREQFEAEEQSEDDDFAPDEETAADTSRYLAARCVRIFVGAGWMGEETLPDYTRVINMTSHARPFLESIARIDEGLSVEYESHVVSVYSLLCGDAARENGHYLVLNAHAQTIALIDSLKVLSQSIREHYERLMEESEGLDVAGILSLHYDAYALDVLDGAYKRLKTSDNLSRYRPRILAQVRDPATGKPVELSLSRVLREKSGGESQTPYYVAIAASFYRFFKDRPDSTVRFVLFDEAFDKLDDERIRKVIEFYSSMGIQIMMAVPPGKIVAIAPLMDHVHIVSRIGQDARIREFRLPEGVGE